MIVFDNGKKVDFLVASGALGFWGKGYWWEQPFRWTGLLRPSEFTIILKTLTFKAKKGNLRWYAPWKCVRLIPDGGGAVNAVGLTNPGYWAWLKHYLDYPNSLNPKYKIIASINPFTTAQANEMADDFNMVKELVALEVNLSCPNTEQISVYNYMHILRAVKRKSEHPVIAKMSWDSLYMCPELEEYVDAFDAINTVPWTNLYMEKQSPLKKYGLEGGVSGRPIKPLAREAVRRMRQDLKITKPIISGGGIDSVEEVFIRKDLGAEAFSIGTLFLTKPWEPNRIVEAARPYLTINPLHI